MFSGSADKRVGRRRFIGGALVVGSAAASGSLAMAADTSSALPQRPHEQGAELSPYGSRSPYEKDVVRVPTELTPTKLTSWDFTPLQDLYGTITPNGLFFERNHGGVPNINPAQHRLLVHGMVDSPRVFTMDDLKRYPPVSIVHFIECSGNGLTEWAKPTEMTVQKTHGLLGCAEWTGIKVSTLLNDLGMKPGAAWVLAEGADAALMDRSIPLEKMMDDAMLVYGQNGKRCARNKAIPCAFCCRVSKAT